MQTAQCNTTDCFLCRHCLAEWKSAIAAHKTTYSFKKGEVLFAEGDPVQGIFFLREGAIKIHKKWGRQKELIIRFAGVGDIVGHRGLGVAENYPVSATALEAGNACFVPVEFLEASIKVNPGLAEHLIQFYAAELQRAEQRMSELARMDVKNRIAHALFALEDSFGKDSKGFISIPISRQDIAAYAGTIYETVFKVFTEWVQLGLIQTEGKHVRVVQADQLKQRIAPLSVP
ncbi:MAG: Crp/Fnr family transcriptional regulator [Bacteroidetes bacterium]|nr:Crp/Fnr family transcriptional regulator [Bacteroidota bacterium]MBS1628919.1 Crp/Fnr family transcriptional regulator [Bacteroidota bacterium]